MPAKRSHEMFALERQAEIAALVRSQKRASVSEIAGRFGVSEATVRRDLETLEGDGHLKRAYGGAVAVEGLRSEIAIDVRSHEHAEEKAAIGRLAASLVEPNDTIMLDASTTTLAMVDYLRGIENLRALTSGVRTAQRLAEVLGQEVYCCGGRLSPSTLSVTGHQAEEFVRIYYADKVFISARAVSAAAGIMDFSEADAHLKQVMLSRSTKKVLLADSSKFGVRAFTVVATLSDVDVFIANRRPDAELMTALEAAGVEVRYPDL